MILVTGGTGLIGAHLLFDLALKQDRIRATKRASSDILLTRKIFGYYTSPENADLLFEKIEWVTADLNDVPALSEAFNGVDFVYHCAALISFDPSDEKALRKTNIEGTANLVNLCISNSIKKLCYVSSVAAIGTANMPDENTKWNPEENHNDYAISKYGAEIEVWRSSQEGIDVVIANPGIVIGPGIWDAGSGKIFSKVDNGLNYHFPKVSGFIGVQDVVKSMIGLMETNVINEKFILVAENLSFETVLKITAKALEKPLPKKQLKKWMIALGWVVQKAGSWFGGKRQITRESINGLYQETYYNNSKIKEYLDFEFTPVSKVIQDTALYYKKEQTKE
ncbi:NAD-dependent epimerase/dehydratase family protein [Christiangramia salexigens]|uniref:NAD-dependent epimerase n=1 Tax=Christiangramia salexigens TaxID=1913577 RepID=A0A1L3J5U2_9FLAO|nr:NAD-dependent epimerase/dehydratase family protein [Christiangramia salexigens]APG60464.1 NAD-dependent epimerase [Christiangramia salexigens]